MLNKGNIMHKPYYIVPISVKGIVFEDEAVWLRKNERNEWELPGGKLDIGEQPETAVIREIEEELGFVVQLKKIVGAHLYTIASSIDEGNGVFVVSYLCEILDKVGDFEIMGEAGPAEFALVPVKELDNLIMPSFYKTMISDALRI